MKKTKKGDCPIGLTAFAMDSTNATWDDFRALNQSQAYKELRLQTIADQGGLCAYCEVHYLDKPETVSIEHFHPKSDLSNPIKNWALDWHNLHAVCRGGRDKNADGQQPYPTPENLSCDAYKDYLVSKNKLTEHCEGKLFNPLLMPEIKIFKLNKSTGALEVDELTCKQIAETELQTSADLIELAKETLRILNLNCQRLRDARLEVLKAYNQYIKKAREQNNQKIHQQLAHRWFSAPWPSYFTTRRDLLGQAAEHYLQKIAYSG